MDKNKGHSTTILTCLALSIVIINSITSAQCAGISLWPKPRIMSWPSPLARLLSPNFTITSPSHQYLSPAVNRYLQLILNEHHHPLVIPTVNLTSGYAIQSLVLVISDLSVPLMHGIDESYCLRIPSSGEQASLIAETAWGAMRGLETFSQLIWGKPSRIASGMEIFDWPIFQHRGILLDTSRNFYKVDDILRTIGAMSANKLNVFHWHITDSHSFPLVLPSEPDLAGKGSYRHDMQYSPENVSRIVEFGLEHGVRILPEIDMPGYKWEDRLASEPGTGQLNPLNPKTYKVVKNAIHDVTSMFPDQFYHAGADEVIPGCWKADPEIQRFLSDGGSLNQILEMFINSTFDYIVSMNRTAVYWEDVLLDQTIRVDKSLLPPKNTILQTWNNGPNNTKRIVSSGYRAIVSSSEYYYLDCGHGSFLGNDSQYDQGNAGNMGTGGSWCGPFKTWQTIYNYDITYGLTEEEAKLVLGGEVALWSEQADPTVLDSRIWPRASAMAEAMWSGNRDEKGMKRYAEATDRLNEWRARMVSRGIKAEPIQPLWCALNPGMCNTVNLI